MNRYSSLTSIVLSWVVCCGCAQDERASAPPSSAASSAAPAEMRPAVQAPPVESAPAPTTTVGAPIAPRHPLRAGGASAAESQPPDSAPGAIEPERSESQDPPPIAKLTAEAAPNAVVEVYYATDRRGVDRVAPSLFDYLQQFRLTAGVALGVALLAMLYQWRRQTRPPWWLSIAGGSAIVFLFALGFLGSLRLADDARRLGRVYGNQRGELEWGKCAVSIPRDHDPGNLESPSIVRFEFREDPDKHVVLQSIERLPEGTFYRELSQTSSTHVNRELFVFVHGFNVTFSDAARRTAQLAHDLPYTGTPVLFSWPSQGRPDPIAYTTDGTTAEWSAANLEQFLDGLISEFGPERLNLVAHSMGNRLLTTAVRQLAQRGRINGKFKEIVLAAPDVDASHFRRTLAPVLVQCAARVTLYASANDEALKISRRVNGAPRAGDTGEMLVVAPGIDTIDVTEVDTTLLGHSYYGSNVTVLADLFFLLTRNLPVEQRGWLSPQERQGLRYWVLQRQALEETALRLQEERRR